MSLCQGNNCCFPFFYFFWYQGNNRCFPFFKISSYRSNYCFFLSAILLLVFNWAIIVVFLFVRCLGIKSIIVVFLSARFLGVRAVTVEAPAPGSVSGSPSSTAPTACRNTASV